VVLDPALPLGLLGPGLGLPYAVVLHGAEVTVPARLPGMRVALRRVLSGACLLVAAGGYPEAEARRLLGRSMPPSVVVPPGVDLERFQPLEERARQAARRRHGLPEEGRVVVSVSRLVPRKGMDVLIEAAALLAPARPDLVVAIGGEGRDRPRLERLVARLRAPVLLLGRVAEEELPELVGCADVAAMLCRDRWLGLEQEGFGIVFLEAAAAGVAALAGRSGGAEEAVLDGVTGLVADRPGDVAVVAEALGRLLDDPGLRARLGGAGRSRAAAELAYPHLATVLARSLAEVGG
jgi:phosphatidylinositol alpha-1,6-mannosyltransferase